MMKLSHFILLGLAFLISACSAAEQAAPTMEIATSTPDQPAPTNTTPPTSTITPSPAPSLTPSATMPLPTPTLPPSLSSLQIVFSDQTQLWIWQNGINQLIKKGEGFVQVKISDDGSLIAFNRNFELWVIDSDGSNERLLVSADDFQSLEPKDPGVRLKDFDWVPGTHTLFFNTRLLYDFGLAYTDDLYQVNADTMQWELLRQQRDGGTFTFSPDGRRVVMVTPQKISVMNVDNSHYRIALEYIVAFPSEASYYAKPKWEPDSQSMLVYIPPEDHCCENPAHILRIFADGTPAEIISELSSKDDEFAFRIWAPGMNHYAIAPLLENQYFLGTDGTDLEPLTEPTNFFVGFLWVDEEHFLYRGVADLMLGTIGAPSILIADSNETGDYVQYWDFTK